MSGRERSTSVCYFFFFTGAVHCNLSADRRRLVCMHGAAVDNDACIVLYYTIFCTTNLANLEAAGTHYFWKYSTTLYGTVLLPPSGCTLHHINKVDIRYFKFAHAGRWLILFKHHFTLLKRFVFLYMWLLKFGHYISHLSINTKASCITYILFAYVTFYMPLIRL